MFIPNNIYFCGTYLLLFCCILNVLFRLYMKYLYLMIPMLLSQGLSSLAPTPILQLPDFSQSFNRYSYCFNSPLRYVA